MSSNALQFDFIPNRKRLRHACIFVLRFLMWARLSFFFPSCPDICRECMQETPRPAHITASFSPSAIPAYPVASTATSSGGHSPPPTPGLTAQQPSPSPSSQMPQPPNRIHLAPQSQQSYSAQSIPSTPLSIPTTDAMTSPASTSCSLPTPQDMVPPHVRSGDEIIGIMIDLMGQKEPEPPTYMYNPQNPYSQMDGNMQQQASSPYIPVTSPSASSDQPCYSPVTPVQSPANRKSNKVCTVS